MLSPLKATVAEAQEEDVLELDEVCSFVQNKKNKRWLWLALCRRTRQIVSFAIGDRSAQTCRQLFLKLPPAYQSCHSFSDFWEAYPKVWKTGKHQSVGKESGETAHVERWNNTLRQRLARYVRKTLSFSKSDAFHHLATKAFIVHHNLQRKLKLSFNT
jgi:IS1 family transposase